ncbi:MAG: class I SAM-dependent methyltransferase [Candidatus Babeliaceae bacterium]
MKKLLFLGLFSCTSLTAELSIEKLLQLIPVTRAEIEDAQKYLDNLEALEEMGWGGYHVIVQNLIKQFEVKAACEVGVSTGLNSYKILKNTLVEILYSVDPYTSYGDPTNVNLAQHTFDIMYYRLLEKLAEFGSRSKLLRMLSADAAPLIADGALDFVFLDANHTYTYVKTDLNLWYPKVKPGGVIAGDDYATVHPGVPQAVDEFFAQLKLKVNQDTEQPRIWWVQKPATV